MNMKSQLKILWQDIKPSVVLNLYTNVFGSLEKISSIIGTKYSKDLVL